MDEPIFVIFNPRSGKGRGAQFVAPVLQGLATAGRVEHALTREPGDEARLARQAVEQGFTRIVAVGGDGTVNEVANGLAGSTTRLLVVPHGTGNVLARELSLPATASPAP